MLISGVCSVSVLVTSILAGYVFAKYRFRGRDALFWLVIGTMFIPPIVTLVPLYKIIEGIGLSDSLIGVMLPWLVNAFGIFLMRQFIADVPDELIDAARVDGAGELAIVRRVVMPLIKPASITLLVFAAVYYWNNYIWPLSVIKDPDKFPVVLTLSRLLSYNMAVGCKTSCSREPWSLHCQPWPSSCSPSECSCRASRGRASNEHLYRGRRRWHERSCPRRS